MVQLELQPLEGFGFVLDPDNEGTRRRLDTIPAIITNIEDVTSLTMVWTNIKDYDTYLRFKNWVLSGDPYQKA